MSETTSVRESTRPADGGDAQPDGQHAPRAPQRRRAQPPRRSARPARRTAGRPAATRASTRSPAPRSERASPPSRGRSDSAAVPAVSASAKAMAMPATSSAPNPRTIGTGDSSRTRKPTPVASAAVAMTGHRHPRGPFRAPLFPHARLVLDRVVDPEPEQHRQHGDRRHRQRQPEQRHGAERDPHGAERDRERQQPRPAAEDEREHDRHEHEADEQQPHGRARKRVREVLCDHRRSRHRVAGVALELPLRHGHRPADELDRLRARLVREIRLQPHLDERRLRRREQVGEARLRRRGAARGVEDEGGDELGVVDARQPGQRQPVAEVDLQQVADELGVDELARRVGEPVLLGRALPLRFGHLPRRPRRALGLGGLGLHLGLDLVVDLARGRVDEGARPVDHLHRLESRPAGRTAPPRPPGASSPSGLLPDRQPSSPISRPRLEVRMRFGSSPRASTMTEWSPKRSR